MRTFIIMALNQHLIWITVYGIASNNQSGINMIIN